MMQTAVEIRNVTHRYKGAGALSLDGFSLTVKAGETLLLCGASGSGKTSVIRLINGLIPHYYHGEMTGDVIVKGLEVANTQLYELAGVVGTVFQNPRSQFFSVDTDGEIVFGPENLGLTPEEIKARKAEVTEQLALEKLLGRSLFELSGGEKQRIACASVAALMPEIILLDEPSSNLDWTSIGKLHEIIREWKRQGKTIIISEHRLWYLNELADRVVYIENGKAAREWSGEEFSRLSEGDTKALQLRPTEVKERYSAMFSEKAESGCFALTDDSDGILLKDFYFAYHRKPYVFWKKKCQPPTVRLSVCEFRNSGSRRER